MAILVKTNIYFVVLCIIASLTLLAYAVLVLWKLLDIIIEVRKTIDDDRKEMDTKTMELWIILLTISRVVPLTW